MLPLLSFLLIVPLVHAHMAPWHPSMYCFNGTTGHDNPNTHDAAGPSYMMPKSDWWMHHFDKCDEFPPEPGNFLRIPSGGSFTVELADDRAFTTYSYGGRYAREWGGAEQHPDDWNDPKCIESPNVHAQNHSMTAGTAWAISYQSDIKKVTPENLVVFSVKYHTPWKRVTAYDVPSNLPECPPEGCHCVWGWVPNHCGSPNMYMLPFKCMVTNSIGLSRLASAQPPVWCEDDQSKCVQGAKQMVYFNQLDGNNVILEGYQKDGQEKSPGYNMKMGFPDGAQNDIFDGSFVPKRRYERPTKPSQRTFSS